MSGHQPFMIVIDMTNDDETTNSWIVRNPSQRRQILGDITRQVDSESHVQVGVRRGPVFPTPRGGSENTPPPPANTGRGLNSNSGYCVKCRQKRHMINVKQMITSNHRRAIQGKCETCGTKMTKFTSG